MTDKELPIFSVGDGVVKDVTWSRSTGSTVFVLHHDGAVATYFALKRIDVTKGQTIRQGEQIGISND